MSSFNPSPNASAFAFVTLNGATARAPDGHALFDNLTLAFGRERTGIVGRNGVGKTTLLRLVAGLDAPAEGTVAVGGTIGWLDQTSKPEPGETVAGALGVADAVARLDRLMNGEGAPDDLERADWTLEGRIDSALARVGLQGLSLNRESGSLSGGEQTRLRLAGLDLRRPDLLVLDEPTNHLDAGARAMVGEMLAAWQGGAVVASHDRALLRRMDRILELTSLGVTIYGGGYDLYAERKSIERAAAERRLATAERDSDRVGRETQRTLERKARQDKAGRAFAAKRSEPKILLGAMAERAENSSARNRNLAEKARAEAEAALTEARQKVELVRTLSVGLPSTGLAACRTVLSMDRVSWSTADGRERLAPVSLQLIGPERVAVSGANGAGKTTLLRIAAGDLAPTSGRIDRSVSSALLDQAAAILNPADTLLDAYRRLNPEATPNEAHAALARFMFRNTAVQRVVGTLSGGERLRAALACVMAGVRIPQLLILDEPTNHLDLDSIPAIETALRGYDGALLVVSHDADFLEAIGVDRTIRLGG